MFGMFDFIGMADTYEERAIDRHKKDGLLVDTCAITDSDQPYETAVAHPLYNDGKIVIVEMYDDIESAQTGHDKWVKTMTEGELPVELCDVSSCGVAGMCDLSDGNWRVFKKEEQ